jgi:hypothetical protein
MSGYNKVMSLYDPDSDEDSSQGGDGFVSTGIGKRRDSQSSGFSLDSALMERFQIDEYDEDTHRRASAYNPAGLTVKAGTAVNIDGDSDDDGQSVGDDRAYRAITIQDTRAIPAPATMDEPEIGSDDEFAPAVHSNFPKTKMSYVEGIGGGDDSSAGAVAGVAVTTGDGKDKSGDGKDKGGDGDKSGRKPQAEVREALARARSGKTAGMASRGRGLSRADVASSTAEKAVEVATAGAVVGKAVKSFAERMKEAKARKASAGGVRPPPLTAEQKAQKKASLRGKAIVVESFVEDNKKKAVLAGLAKAVKVNRSAKVITGVVRAVGKQKTREREGLVSEALVINAKREGRALSKEEAEAQARALLKREDGGATPRPSGKSAKSGLLTEGDPKSVAKGAGVADASTVAEDVLPSTFTIPMGNVELSDTKGGYSKIKFNGTALKGGDWKTAMRIRDEVRREFGKDQAPTILKKLDAFVYRYSKKAEREAYEAEVRGASASSTTGGR